MSAAHDALAGRTAAGMTHAWLFTGPPGSGRSNAARAFAAALLCELDGCGRCLACRTALAGSHADVTRVVTDQAVIRVDAVRELVRKASLAPAGDSWQLLIVEDADRLTDSAADALLKSIEEPPPRTVWLLCAPTVEDVVSTLRSRCRSVVLRTPPTAAVVHHLVTRYDVPDAVATFAARASQGHIGRARALARDEAVRNRRREVLRMPSQLSDLGSCMTCAANLVDAATEEAPASQRLAGCQGAG
ncbi:MAG: DNA polymerase III subunit delta' [Nocardioidaceae bacterium]